MHPQIMHKFNSNIDDKILNMSLLSCSFNDDDEHDDDRNTSCVSNNTIMRLNAIMRFWLGVLIRILIVDCSIMFVKII